MTNTTNEAAWKALWLDPKYIKLHERKDRWGARWNVADANKDPSAPRFYRLFRRAIERISAYEEKKGMWTPEARK